MRVPSWCDRVLWKSRPGTNITLSNYTNVDAVASRYACFLFSLPNKDSDHSPVYASFRLGVRMPISIISSPGEVHTLRGTREAYIIFSKVSAKINLTRGGGTSSSNQRATLMAEDELRSPVVGGEGEWNTYIKFLAPFIAQDKKYKTTILKRVCFFHVVLIGGE